MTRIYTGYTPTKANAALDVLPQHVPGGGRTVASLPAFLANNAVAFNVLDFLATGDGVTDDTAAIQAAINAAAASDMGGIVDFPRGVYRYSTLNMAGVRNVLLRGVGSSGPFTVGTTQLICTRTDAGVGISLADAQGVRVENLCLDHLSSSFTGTIVKLGHGALARDPSHVRFHNVAFSAQAGTCVLLDLEFAILVTVSECAFRGGTRQIIGHQGNYCNVVAIRDCEFAGSSLVPILQPGEAWTIEGCAFEGLASGAQGAVTVHTGGTYYSYGFRYLGNWHGDASSAVNPWVRIRTLGGVFQGGEWVMAAGGIGLQLAAGSTCPTGHGMRMSQNGAGAIGLDFESTVAKPAFLGNDLQVDTPLRNQGNCVGGTIRNNNNATEIVPFAVNAATPTVGGGDVFTTANAIATTITNFLNGYDGQRITVLLGTNDTVQHNATIHTNGGGNIVGAAGMVVQFVRVGAVWLEVSRVTAT